MNEDEYPKERAGYESSGEHLRLRGTSTTAIDTRIVSTKDGVYHQQPSITALPILPRGARVSPSHQQSPSDGSSYDPRPSDISSTAKPHEFDADALFSRTNFSGSQQQHESRPHRPSTSDSERGQRRTRPSPNGSLHRQALVPLPLGPVVLRDPHDLAADASARKNNTGGKRRHHRSESTQDLLSNAASQSYFENRETPYQRCTRKSTEALALRSVPSGHPQGPKATVSTPSLSSSFKHHTRDSSNSSMLSERPKTGARLQRKRSNPHPAGDSDVEKEVLELNTIVEERRIENKNARSRGSHVPAVAPSMQVRARSETLNDIGSALSRPLTDTKDASPPIDTVPDNLRPKRSTSTYRVPGWLSGVSAPNATQEYASGEPFYRCSTMPPPHQETRGATSASSSFTALDSASYTLESSPTPSKRYSRSLMITPVPAGDDGVGGGEGKVGVAL